ncbi:hypothetical protein J1605_009796, partial [Eschrichtius robustus]
MAPAPLNPGVDFGNMRASGALGMRERAPSSCLYLLEDSAPGPPRRATGRLRPHAPGVAGSAAPGDGPAAGAPRLLGPGAVRGPAGEGKVAAGAMEGVLYKWTNYLSGVCAASHCQGPVIQGQLPRENARRASGWCDITPVSAAAGSPCTPYPSLPP